MKIVCVMVTSIDGVAAKSQADKIDWSSKEDKKSFVAETKKHGVVIVGRATFEAIGRPLPGRLNLVMTSTPERFADQTKPGEIEFVKGSPQEIVALLERRGFESAALIGGPHLNAEFFKENLVDEVLLTIEPLLFGQGFNFTEGSALNLKAELIETKQLNKSCVQLCYKIIQGNGS